jgi:hypothetical protein
MHALYNTESGVTEGVSDIVVVILTLCGRDFRFL